MRAVTRARAACLATMARTCVVVAALLALGASCALAQTPTLEDEWWTPGFAARVRLAPCNDKAENHPKTDRRLCGTILWAWDETPTGASDKRPLVGQRIINGMQPDKPGVHAGNIYNPEDGQTYKATMRLKTPNTLLVAGCVLFICREQVWRRYDSVRSPPVAAMP